MTKEPQATKPIKPYDEVKSEFIKKEIENRDFDKTEHRKYVHTLIRFEEYILGNFNPGWPEGMVFSSAKSSLQKHYDTIHKELKPEEFKEKKREEERKKKEREKEEQKRIETKKKELEKSRVNWKNTDST